MGSYDINNSRDEAPHCYPEAKRVPSSIKDRDSGQTRFLASTQKKIFQDEANIRQSWSY